ncbi:MAG: NAD(P)H-hydrate dehydratase [Kiritimatiellae bacterium]|jgi:hydroxyethylthiazole kinase-like uncharacterized protein yjeF|nr:NAD(P)H-hydrate dehydratase [Kiritimatiellia bacterium]
MKFLTVNQMRAADAAAISECDIPEQILMNRAGVALARCVMRVAHLRRANRIILIAGHGNNGGDIFVAARCLHKAGFSAHVIMTCIPSSLKGAAHIAWDEMQSLNVPFEVISTVESWQKNFDLKSGTLLNYGVVVDGILGTGCSGEPREVAAEAIQWINSIRAYCLIVSADLPSGMNGDTGIAAGAVVKADLTVTFAAPKQGFCSPDAIKLIGHLIVSDIGIPDEITFKSVADAEFQLIARPELTRAYRGREWDAHKGRFGHVCIMGGSENYPNAPVLSSLGALRSGAGLVTLWSWASSQTALSLIPEVIIRKAALDDFYLADLNQRSNEYNLDKFNVVVIGPGLGQSDGAKEFIKYVLDNFKGRVVLDADGLNILAALSKDGYKIREALSLIITPHPGEAARLLECTTAEIQDNRSNAVKSLALRYNAIAVLKGAGTLVSDGKSMPWVNMTGNPGMASAGMGDVLAGMIGGVLAQGLDDMTAVTMAVWAHSSAGDFAAIKGSQTSLTATDLVNMLPDIYQNIER